MIDLASPTGHRATVRRQSLQVPNTMTVYSALPSISTCLPRSALREERTDWKPQAQVTHRGYWEDCVPTPGVSRTLVYLLKPLDLGAGQALASENHPTKAYTHAGRTHSVLMRLPELPRATAVHNSTECSSLCNSSRWHPCCVRCSHPVHTCTHDTHLHIYPCTHIS